MNLSNDERRFLGHAAEATFLTKLSPSQDGCEARTLRSSEDLADLWSNLFEKRRQWESDDRRRIDKEETIGQIWTCWMWDWIAKSLEPRQWGYKTRQTKNKYIQRVYSKHVWTRRIRFGFVGNRRVVGTSSGHAAH